MTGGWSAKGQPCDKFHCHWRAGCDLHADALLGFSEDLFCRPKYEDLPITSSGVIKHEVKPADLIQSCLWSWFNYMPIASHTWAWIECGLVTEEEMAAMQGITHAEVNERVASAKAAMRHNRLCGAPAVEIPPVSEALRVAVEGEVSYLWQVSAAEVPEGTDPSTVEYQVLPDNLSVPFQRALAQHNRKHTAVQQKVAKAEPGRRKD